ncbi:MAG: ArnT family glycosyltransferase [Cytophagaceae bacterium]
MITYFRNFDAIKLPALLILLLAMRLPMLYMGMPLTIPELSWMLVGEKLGNGFVMYRDVWENLEPLSAWVYYIIDMLFNGSIAAYRTIALLLIFIQALICNYIYNMNLVREKTMIPALMYVAFSFLYFDFMALSPTLMCLTFILLMFYYIIYLLKHPEENEKIFSLGISAGLAALFYYPAITLLVFIIIAYVFLTPANLRKLFLLLIGFVLPFAIISVYYFWHDGLYDFYQNFLLSLLTLPTTRYIENETLILIISLPAFVVVASAFIVLSSSNLTNYTNNIIKMIILYLVLASISFLFLTRNISTYQLYIFLPGIVYFATFGVLQLRRKRLQEFSFFFILGLMLFFNYGSLYNVGIRSDITDNEALEVERAEFHTRYSGKKVWVTGDDRNYYMDNSLGMPYLNMFLAERHFAHLDDYRIISEVYANFERHKPEVILDHRGVMPAVLQYIPILNQKYQQLEGTSIYVRK